MSLYQIKTNSNDGFNVIKFDNDINYENTYNVKYRGKRLVCNCPAYLRKSCRHRDMLPIFELENAIDSGRFYNFEQKRWMDHLNAD